jgi:hypothetical protein
MRCVHAAGEVTITGPSCPARARLLSRTATSPWWFGDHSTQLPAFDPLWDERCQVVGSGAEAAILDSCHERCPGGVARDECGGGGGLAVTHGDEVGDTGADFDAVPAV